MGRLEQLKRFQYFRSSLVGTFSSDKSWLEEESSENWLAVLDGGVPKHEKNLAVSCGVVCCCGRRGNEQGR